MQIYIDNQNLQRLKLIREVHRVQQTNSHSNKYRELNDRSGSRAAATSKIECFVIIVNGWKPLTIITRRFILDVAAALDPPLISFDSLMTFLALYRGIFRFQNILFILVTQSSEIFISVVYIVILIAFYQH